MEGALVPSSTLSPANPVVMNVVYQFTVYDPVLGVWRQRDSGRPFGPASKRKGAGKEWESQGYYRRWQIQLRVINNFLY